MRSSLNSDSAVRTARLAGILHLATLPVGYFSLVHVPRVLADGLNVAPPVQIARLLRLGVASDIAGQVLFACAVLLLHELLKPAQHRLANLMLLFALVGVPMACLSEVPQLAAANGLLSGTPGESVTRLLDLRNQGLQLTELFWGLWLLPAALLFYGSRLIPRLIPALIGVAGVAYLIDWSLALSWPELNLPLHHLFTLELTLPLWLTLRGIDRERWEALMTVHPEPKRS